MANPGFCQKGWPVPAAQRFVLCPVGRAIAVAANEKRYDENARREGPLGYSMDWYPLVNYHSYGKIHHFQWENPL